MWNIISIQHGSKELWPGHRFWLCVHCDLELGNMALATNHDIPFGHGQHMWKILSTSNMGIRSYGPDKTWACIQLDGQGDRQSGWCLYYSLNFVLGWYNFQNYMYQTKCLVRYKTHWFKIYSIISGYRHEFAIIFNLFERYLQMNQGYTGVLHREVVMQ